MSAHPVLMTSNPSMPGTPAAGGMAAATLARSAASALAVLSKRVHPGWIASLGADIAAFGAQRPALLDDLLLSRYDLRWPDLSAPTHGLENLWLLPPGQVRRLCSARALYTWRDALNRCVMADVRRKARALVGDLAFQVLTGRPDKYPHSITLPASLDSDEVCGLGWLQIRAALPWRDERSRRLVDLMLPPTPASAAPAHSAFDDHPLFMADLPAMFPEHSWLFGSSLATTT